VEEESGIEERIPLDDRIVDRIGEVFRDWLEEEGINEVISDAAREGAAESLEGAMPFWKKKASKG